MGFDWGVTITTVIDYIGCAIPTVAICYHDATFRAWVEYPSKVLSNSLECWKREVAVLIFRLGFSNRFVAIV